MSSNDVVSKNFNLTKKDFFQVFKRSFALQASYNYERLQALGFDYAIMGVLRKIYADDEEAFREALLRHTETFNMTVAPAPFVMGIAISMEEQNAMNKDYDTSAINAVKVALMGPLSGIGDTFFWGIFRVLGASIGVQFAINGSPLGAIIFLLLFNIPNVLTRYYGLYLGYNNGSEFLTRIQENGQMALFTYCAGIIGLMAVGAMIATQIWINCPVVINIQGVETVVQDYINQLMPQFLPLVFTLGVFYFLKKGFSQSKIMLGLVVLGFVLGILGIIG